MTISHLTMPFRDVPLSPHPERESTTKAGACAENLTLSADTTSVERVVFRRDGKQILTRVGLGDVVARRPHSSAELASWADRAYLRSSTWPGTSSHARSVRVVDLFSGCGIMSLGVWEACRAIGRRMRPVLAVDTNAEALDVYQHNFPQAGIVTNGVETLLDAKLGARLTTREQRLRRTLGHIDVLVGGPPCQGHSNLNNHTRRSDPKNRLYDRMARFAEVVSPTHIIIENVSAVLHDRGSVVEHTTAALHSLGYRTDAGVADASALGVPQHRRRHFLVASLVETPNLTATITAYSQPERSVWWAIEDLQNREGQAPFDRAGLPSDENKRRIDYLFDEDVYDLPDQLRPECHREKLHSYKSVYGRMHRERPAQTITSGFGSMGQGRFVHPTRRRTVTPHEAARLQFIPDFFNFRDDVRRTSLAEMIGNAVPPKMTYFIALELLR